MLCSTFFLFACVPAFSQTATGRISGTVKDQSGGAIVGASVVVTDVARGLTRNLTTDDVGAYLASNLIAGAYTVRATFTGFQTFERSNIILPVGGDLFVDVVLQPGAQTQTITVTEELPLVNTTSSTLGGTLTAETITDLPLNGRNFTLLLELRPGVVLTLGNDSGGTGAASTNGLRPEQSNEYLVEGLHAMSPFNGQPIMNALALRGDAATLLPVDAIQEFNQQFNNKAEYGFRPGGAVNIGLKSGTNAYHGTGYAFFRRDALDSQNYFSPKLNTNLNQFGATLGGPIKQDKMFFFIGYEGQRVDQGDSVRSSTPFTDTSLLTGPGGFPGCLATQSCTGVVGVVPGARTVDATNHLILACQGLAPARRSPQSLKLAGLNPADCSPTSSYPNSTTGATWFVPHGATDHGLNAIDPITSYYSQLQSEVRALGSVGKVDYALNDKHTINGFTFIGNADNIYSANKTNPDWRTRVKARASLGAGTWTWLPNASWANAFRVGYARNIQKYIGVDVGDLTAADLGLPTGVINPADFSGINNGYPQSLAINGFTALGSRNTELEGPHTSLEINDTINFLTGNHNIRFGGMIINQNQNGGSWGDSRGRFGFGQGAGSGGNSNGLIAFMNGQLGYSDNIPGALNYCPAPGVVVGSTCVGQPAVRTSSGNTGLQTAILFYGNHDSHVRNTVYSGFVQDDWRIKPTLTLNLGLRYDLTTVLHDRDNILASFNPQVGLVQEGVQVPRIYNPDHNNFSPRVGFAWDVRGNGKTVVRAGGSLIYELVHIRTYTEIGNDIGLVNNPTAWVNGCTVNILDSSGDPIPNPAVPGIGAPATNCEGLGGQLTYPGGTNNNGSVEWRRDEGTIGAVNWDGPINNGFGTIYPGAGVLNCSPHVTVRDNPQTSALERPGSGCPVVTADSHLRTPYVTSWNLSIQHAITNNIVADIAYVGNHGTKFMSHGDVNQADPAGNYWFQPVNGISGTTFADDCVANQDSDSCDGSSISDLIFNSRPYNSKFPYLNTITTLRSTDFSNYNGLQISVTARNYRGFSLQSGYTWSKSLDVASGNGADIGVDNYSPWLNYGRANSDVRHRFTASPTWRLPGVMGYGGLLEGWKVNGNLKYQTGRPYSTSFEGDFRGNGYGENGRSDFFGQASDFEFDRHRINVPVFHPANGATGDSNPQTGGTYAASDLATATPLCTSNARSLATLAAFGCWTQGGSAITPPALGSFGNMSRGLLSGTPFFGLDMSVTKTQRITERVSAEFRAEFFNILNTPAFAQVENGLDCGTDCATSGLGRSTATPDTDATNPVLGSGGPRRVQVGVKLTF